MGTFDTIHVNGRAYQTKALGCAMRELRIGDTVTVMYKSNTEHEYELSPEHAYDPSPADFSFQARDISSGGMVSFLVAGGVLVGQGEHRKSRFDSHGRSIGEAVWRPHIAENKKWTESKRHVNEILRKHRARVGR